MSDALLWNEMGNLYLKIGSPEGAIAAYTKAIELNPDSGWSYYNLGNAYFQVGEYGHALFLFRKGFQLMDTPENQAVIWNKMGDAYRALKDIENAIQAYKKADDLDMGALLAEQNAGKKPIDPTTLRSMLKGNEIASNKNDTPSVTQKKTPPAPAPIDGQAHADGFQPINVLKGIDLDPTSPHRPETRDFFTPVPNRITDEDKHQPSPGTPPFTTRGVPDLDTTPLPKEKKIIVFPASSATEENLAGKEIPQNEPGQPGNSITTQGQDVNAEGKLKGSTNVRPCIDDLEEILAKVRIYENITKVNPTNDRAWDTLGKLYKSLGRHQDAISAYKKAIEKAPDREVYYYYLGLLFSVEQQHEEAVLAFEFVLRKNPDYILAHSALAGVYHRMGQENKANHHIAIALPKMNNESAYNRACFYAICGDKELAFEFLRVAIKNKDTTVEWIKSDPDLDPIRPDPRYQEFINEINQPSAEKIKENYFSSEMEGTHNPLLPILNQSLTR